MICIAILVGFFLLLGDVSFSEQSVIVVDWETSGGLREGAPVKVVGMRAGRVESIDYLGGRVDEKVGRKVWVRVTLSIKPELRKTLTAGAKFYITTLGLLGEKYIEIDPGPSDQPLPADIAFEGVPPMRMEVMAESLNKTLVTATRILADNEHRIGKTLEDISAAAASGRQAMADGQTIVGEVKETLRKIEKRGIQALDKVEVTIGDAQATLGTVREAVEEYTPGKGKTGDNIKAITDKGRRLTTSLDRAIGDGAQVAGAIHDARALSGKARSVIDQVGGKAVKVAGRIEGLVDTADAMLIESKGTVLDATKQVRVVLTAVAEILAKVRDGRGTIGAILNDREMFDDARELMKDLKRHPWKFLWKE